MAMDSLCYCYDRSQTSFIPIFTVEHSFFYLLVDDALAIHEKVGRLLARHWGFTPPFGIRLQDVGELVVSAGVGLGLASLILLSLHKSNKSFKNFSLFLTFSFVGLIFFGVVVDTLNGGTEPGSSLKAILVIIEDGGEMIVASIMLAGSYSFLRQKDTTSAV